MWDEGLRLISHFFGFHFTSLKDVLPVVWLKWSILQLSTLDHGGQIVDPGSFITAELIDLDTAVLGGFFTLFTHTFLLF